ncbi:sodium/hydrogen exchanger family protein [Lyngbya aestuarii BL J]|uniref:Sodium/hydrogen exchanger family protein n=1 Tax=Lyngbya aestuarii BL J TaxID=1348334 RepID=U7QBQ2_9CYAN|nr:sodium:proton antiporter [Lyngbya aestuarii]ERT04430.1 sodium/hydrogen exchanger family protein [Lyngbya aestuarii BL J]
MDTYILILLVISLLLLGVTWGSGWISRLPLSYAVIYLAVGIILSPYGLNLINLRPNTEFLERLSELVVIISLFGCGLKMNRQLNLTSWNITVRLIAGLMPFSIFAVAVITHFILKLSWGEAILFGAILAPTDPVLASEVQLKHPHDPDELRFGLTSEGGLNDALAFPFVYFGIHWLKDDNWQNWFKQWVVIDLIWAIFAGIVMGIIVTQSIVWVDRKLLKIRPTNDIMEDFIAISIILATYSLTELVNGYGFLGVFVAGIVARKSYKQKAKPFSQLEFIEQVEKLLEVVTILLLGSLLRIEPIIKYIPAAILIAGLLIFVVRPLGAWLFTIGTRYHNLKRLLLGWFGIRGVGSIYYLTYALGEGLQGSVGELIAWSVYIIVTVSIIIHGISSTPLMNWYEKHIDLQS